MIEKCTDAHWVQPAVDYIGNDWGKVPYLFANLRKYGYGAGNPRVHLWVDVAEGVLHGVYLLYFDCLHFMTRDDNYPEKEFLTMVDALQPRVIMLTENFGQRMAEVLKKRYSLDRDRLYTMGDDMKMELSPRGESARREDMAVVADMVVQDAVFHAIYDRSVLLAQLLNRFDEGYGRSFVIRENNEIACFYCSSAENEHFFISGITLVDKKYRGMGYGSEIVRHLLYIEHQEGRMGIALIEEGNIPSRRTFEKLGSRYFGMLYKLVLRDQNQ